MLLLLLLLLLGVLLLLEIELLLLLLLRELLLDEGGVLSLAVLPSTVGALSAWSIGHSAGVRAVERVESRSERSSEGACLGTSPFSLLPRL